MNEPMNAYGPHREAYKNTFEREHRVRSYRMHADVPSWALESLVSKLCRIRSPFCIGGSPGWLPFFFTYFHNKFHKQFVIIISDSVPDMHSVTIGSVLHAVPANTTNFRR